MNVDVRIDWRLVVAFALVVLALVGAAPWMLTSFSPVELALFACLASLGFFGALALHELVRVAALRAAGVPVTRVTLLVLGSTSDVEPSGPGAEVSAAIVAVAASALAGAGALAVTALLAGGIPSDVVALERGGPGLVALAWLGLVNVLVALLHVAPAFPLEGGRIVRAAVWRATGDATRATRWAATSGCLVGWALVFVGVALAHARNTSALGILASATGWALASSAVECHARFAITSRAAS